MWWLAVFLVCVSLLDIVIKSTSAPRPRDDLSNGARVLTRNGAEN